MLEFLFKTIIGTLLSMILGGIWYSDSLFAKQWVMAVGISQEQLQDSILTKGMKQFFITEILCRVVRTLSFLLIASYIKTNIDLISSFNLAMWIFIGVCIPQVIFSCNWEKKNLDYFSIKIGEAFFTMLILAFITPSYF